LGGKDSSFDMTDLHFSRQHHARFVESTKDYTIISVFDNASGEYGKNDNEKPSNEVSRSLLLRVNHPKGKPVDAKTLQVWGRPDGQLTELRGSTQLLRNGNVFTSWSKDGYQSEHSADGELLEEAGFISERYSTYRAYKHQWVGKPKEPPIVVAEILPLGDSQSEKDGSGMTVFYASWNGATEIATWKFYSIDEDGKSTLLGSTPKDGFETTWVYNGIAKEVRAEAVDKDGNSLRKTKKKITILPHAWSNPLLLTKGPFEDHTKAPESDSKDSAPSGSDSSPQHHSEGGAIDPEPEPKESQSQKVPSSKTKEKLDAWKSQLSDQLEPDNMLVVACFAFPMLALIVWLGRRRVLNPFLRSANRTINGYKSVPQDQMSQA
jgi:hypothetical protein